VSWLLDTSACIAFLRGQDEAIREAILGREPDQLRLCSVVRADLEYGARRSERVEDNLHRVRAFCAPMQSLTFDDEAAERYGLIRVQLEREGRIIGANDLLIAAIGMAADATIVTKNAPEFRRVAGLRVEVW
jgi:tRNA(fMet)-specific endonuclease VapC